MIFVPEVIGRVIDGMRKEGNYTSFTNAGTTYTVESPNELLEGEWIIILDTVLAFGFEYAFPIVFTDDLGGILADPVVFGQFQAINVTADSFDIVSETAIPSVGGWKSLEPFFMFGHRQEISNRLLMKDKDRVYKYQKYPLFVLRLDFPEDVTSDHVHEVTLNMAIMDSTDKNYRAPERYEKVFHPILMPLYFDFIEKLQASSETMGTGYPEHTKIDRPFWGVDESGRNVKYIFSDPLDAIELQNLKLKLLDNKC
ncbi:MAG: hypothetical protein DRI83_11075 [Bacteroidetes bacterium]|nr:MAG: hypothetical protein DRI83_11075 [Bacteroidota bacterium]